MNSRQKMLVMPIILAMGVFNFSSAVYAQSSPPTSDTLADLVANGGILGIDDKVFSGFNFLGSGLTSFDPTQIIVTASQNDGVDYLTWSGNIALASAGISIADLKLNYIVTANPGMINLIDQSYTGSAQNGFLAVDETVATGSFGGTVVGFSHLQVGDMSDPPPETVQGDNLTIDPSQSILYVTKDIGLAVNSSSGGFITISQVSQSFHQVAVPEPSSFGLLSVGGLSLLAWTYRRRCGKHLAKQS
jgi:hypothetical protein